MWCLFCAEARLPVHDGGYDDYVAEAGGCKGSSPGEKPARLGVAPCDCLGLPPGTLANFQIWPGAQPVDSACGGGASFDRFLPERLLRLSRAAAALQTKAFSRTISGTRSLRASTPVWLSIFDVGGAGMPKSMPENAVGVVVISFEVVNPAKRPWFASSISSSGDQSSTIPAPRRCRSADSDIAALRCLSRRRAIPEMRIAASRLGPSRTG